MKILRYRDVDGTIGFAAIKNQQAFAIEGDIFGSHFVTDRTLTNYTVIAPIEPKVIIGIGLNYRHHAVESNLPIPQIPVVFLKFPNTLQDPDEPILLPSKLRSEQVDYEAELAVVIGETCKNVARDEALNYVLGYTCANDVSARDWQLEKGGSQWCRGKSFDTFCPLGPMIVTRDEIPNPNDLSIKATLNGQVVQDWNTSDMIFDVASLIAFLSGSTTLLPGTVILTGTPHGVGMARTPPLWLKDGDQVSIEIEKIGILTNPVQNEI